MNPPCFAVNSGSGSQWNINVFLLHMLFPDMNRDKGSWCSASAYGVSPHSDLQGQKDTHHPVHLLLSAFTTKTPVLINRWLLQSVT